jgi:hypothetical protein
VLSATGHVQIGIAHGLQDPLSAGAVCEAQRLAGAACCAGYALHLAGHGPLDGLDLLALVVDQVAEGVIVVVVEAVQFSHFFIEGGFRQVSNVLRAVRALVGLCVQGISIVEELVKTVAAQACRSILLVVFVGEYFNKVSEQASGILLPTLV